MTRKINKQSTTFGPLKLIQYICLRTIMQIYCVSNCEQQTAACKYQDQIRNKRDHDGLILAFILKNVHVFKNIEKLQLYRFWYYKRHLDNIKILIKPSDI